MKLKRLYIKDFGIFSHQELGPLAPGLILIGGRNRAGKSTFLQILRYLGFGFPRSASLPPAREKHEVEGEMTLETGEDCHFRLQGSSEPVVSYLSGDRSRPLSMQQIYGDLDPFTYHQVFTVSLDELQRLPGETARSEEERLQAVLLGAGFAEIARLPQLEDEYRKQAAEIGGKYGKPGVQRFKEYFQAIRGGMEERDRALKQVDEYQRKKEEKRECTEKIGDCSKELAVLKRKIDRLDLLKSNYEGYQRFSQLGLHLAGAEADLLLNSFPAERLQKVERLRERYEEALTEYGENRDRFEQAISNGDPAAAGEVLLREKEELRRLGLHLSGLREKIRVYREQQGEWEEEERELRGEMNQVNEAWQGDFERILALRTDSLEEAELNWRLEAYRKAQQELENCERDIAGQKGVITRLTELAGGRKGAPAGGLAALNRNLALTILFILLGTGLSLFHRLLGIGVIATGLVLMTFLMLKDLFRRKEEELYSRQLLEERKRHLAMEEKKAALKKELLPLATEVNKYRQLLGLPEEAPPGVISDYFRRVQELKKAIGKWRATGERLAETHRQVETELEELRALASRLAPVFPAFTGDDELFAGLEQSLYLLELAEKLAAGERKIKGIEDELRPLLAWGAYAEAGDLQIPEALAEFRRQGERYEELAGYRNEHELIKKQILQSLRTDRARKAWQEPAGTAITGDDASDNTGADAGDGDDELFAAFTRLAQEYTSLQELEREYKRAQAVAVELEKRWEELKEEERKLQAELETLATTERLEKAQQQIDQARAGMRPLAEKYAVYSAAAFFLAKMRENFLERARDTLLKEAGKIFTRLTAGRYQQVLPGDDLRKVDFKAVMDNGNLAETTAVLSRATQEQLFLAVRLSRIKEIQVPLPVILDDSLVNFDRRHLERSVELLKELAGTHQIFVLTCHPHLVEAVQAAISPGQYWRLEEGKFSPVEAGDLVKYLRE
ncbi:MAG TPA: AAA family ATPase [Firmicutes bacterium]|nr:AAA family ATPase [Bacillota bacterium]